VTKKKYALVETQNAHRQEDVSAAQEQGAQVLQQVQDGADVPLESVLQLQLRSLPALPAQEISASFVAQDATDARDGKLLAHDEGAARAGQEEEGVPRQYEHE
jgi:hypothetical protein